MVINNINGITESSCKCGSWLQHWAKFSGVKIPCCCAVYGCNEEAKVGAHVNKEGDHRDWYIVPLCYKHNQIKNEMLNLKRDTVLVPAVVGEGCGK